MSNEREILIAAKAMQESKAWPVVFKAGSAIELAKAALAAVEQDRKSKDGQHE